MKEPVHTIIVTYNGMRWLERCLSALRESSLPTKVIVVDNASTDGTPDRITSDFPEVELIRSPENLGFGQANNKGIKIALDRGAGHVLLLNQDAYVKEDTIGRLVETSEQNSAFGVLSPMHLNGSGDALDINFSYNISPRHCPGLMSDLVLDSVADKVYPVAFVNAAAWLITRQCLLTVGGFSPTFFHYGEDDNYIHRLHYHGLKCGIVPEAWIHHDRETRLDNSFRDDEGRSFLRNAMLRISDPAASVTVAQEMKYLLRNGIVETMMFNRARAKLLFERRRMMATLDAAGLEEARRISRTRGASFL